MSLKNSNNSSRSAKKPKKRDSKSARNSLVRGETHGQVTSYTLPANGLTVLYARVKGSETVTTSIVYLVGSRHEETGDTGLAHMLEHMLFKPTSGKGMKWKDLENKGAHLNATTWLDRTLYYFTLPKEYLGDMLEVEADRMRNTLLTDKEFLPERANVLSEYEMHFGNPTEVLEWSMLSTAFSNHGYQHDTIGWRGDIERYTTSQLKRFYNRYYWPGNATLIVAGDIDEKLLTHEVVKHFGHLASGEVYVPPVRIEAPQQGVRRTELRRDTPLRVLNIAFKAPAFTHPDWLPLMVALNYLTDGETSPLYKATIESGLATDIQHGIFPTHDPFLAFLTISGREGVPYAHIERAVVSTLDRTKKKGIPTKKLALIKESLLADELQSRDGSRNVALTLSEYVATGDWKRYPGTMREIANVSVDDVVRAMHEYLTLTHATIGTLEKP